MGWEVASRGLRYQEFLWGVLRKRRGQISFQVRSWQQVSNLKGRGVIFFWFWVQSFFRQFLSGLFRSFFFRQVQVEFVVQIIINFFGFFFRALVVLICLLVCQMDMLVKYFFKVRFLFRKNFLFLERDLAVLEEDFGKEIYQL